MKNLVKFAQTFFNLHKSIENIEYGLDEHTNTF